MRLLRTYLALSVVFWHLPFVTGMSAVLVLHDLRLPDGYGYQREVSP
jgi:hypothetical protein